MSTPQGTIPVYLVDGPCDGRTINVTAAEFRTGSVTCGGAEYLIDQSLASRAHPVAAGLKGGPHEVVVVKGAASATGAWTRLMRHLAHTGPQSHRRILRVTARARRIAR